jgi:hypothetical protein
VTMDEEQVTALEAAVTIESGITCDGLQVSRDDDGYRFSLPDVDRRGLDADELARVAEANAEWVTNWYFWHEVAPAEPARYDFLRHVERVAAPDAPERTRGDGATYDADAVPARYDALRDGVARQWGQLYVSLELADDGYRRYEVRHVDDADVDADDLEDHADPLDAHQLAKFDADGRYRPLKTAPTLRGGWRFPELTSREVVDVVEYFYPATIPNWHREREEELDVDHWVDATGRQTGMYRLIETWNRGEGHEHVEWVAEACCADSEDLKRREWEYDENTELDAPKGDGVFPAREPNSMIISAAREWTKLEGEQSRTYEFELTPSEKEQVEAIVDAVADGRAADVREADFGDDANRWRARYLRAKRFDDDGNLSGVPTDRED